MKNRKRIFAALTALALLASMTSCSAEETASSSAAPPQQSEAEETVSQAEEQPVEQEPYTVAIAALGDASTEACAEVAEAASKILEEKYNTTVTLIRYGYLEYDQQMQLALAGGEKLDLISSGFFSCSLDSAAASGQVLALNELLESSSELYAAVTEEDWRCMQRGGQIYGVPNGKEHASGYGFSCVTEMLEQLDYDVSSIEEEADLEGLLRAVKETFPGVDPIVTSGGNMGGVMSYRDTLGNDYGVLEDCRTDSTELVNWFATDTYRSICDLHYRWAQEGLIMADASSNSETASTLIAAGTAFGYFHNNKPGIEEEDESATGKDMTMIPIIDAYSTTSNLSECWMIPYQCEQPERALQVLSEMYLNPELGNLFAYGIESKHWEFADEEQGLIDFPEGVSASTTDYSVAAWAWPNELILYVFGADADPELWKKTDEFNETAFQSVGKGFSFDSSSVLNEIAACNNVVSKYDNPLQAGALDPAEAIPKFLEELEAAGINTIIDEKQRQFDEWLAAQNS